MNDRDRFQELVDRFSLDKAGAQPFDGPTLDESHIGASHGERVSIAFLLNVWNPDGEWKIGKFDVMDALGIWDADKRSWFYDWG